jgi:Glycosyl hydrolases family 15
LRILYDIHGNLPQKERTLDHLAGCHSSRRVRVGNAAVNQLQLDVYGEVIEAKLMAGSQGFGFTRMNIPYMLGAMLTPSRDRASLIGFLLRSRRGASYSRSWAPLTRCPASFPLGPVQQMRGFLELPLSVPKLRSRSLAASGTALRTSNSTPAAYHGGEMPNAVSNNFSVMQSHPEINKIRLYVSHSIFNRGVKIKGRFRNRNICLLDALIALPVISAFYEIRSVNSLPGTRPSYDNCVRSCANSVNALAE